MIIKIYSQNPNQKSIDKVVDILNNDGVIIYPTDSVYAYGCSLKSVKAIERLKAIRGKKDSELTIACEDLSAITDCVRVDNDDFKILKRNLPGPFTFILGVSSKLPSKALEGRKTVGIRVPGNSISMEIIRALGCPMVTSSVKNIEEEYTTDPELIDELYGGQVDVVVDGGYGQATPTAIIDLSGDEVEIIREGKVEIVL